jgi:hypothetical protein
MHFSFKTLLIIGTLVSAAHAVESESSTKSEKNPTGITKAAGKSQEIKDERTRKMISWVKELYDQSAEERDKDDEQGLQLEPEGLESCKSVPYLHFRNFNPNIYWWQSLMYES